MAEELFGDEIFTLTDEDGKESNFELIGSRELDGRIHIIAVGIPDINQRPAFLSENGLTPMERGSAIHAYLRALDYDDVRKTEEEKLLSELFRQRDKMLLDGKLLKAEANAVRL